MRLKRAKKKIFFGEIWQCCVSILLAQDVGYAQEDISGILAF